MSRISLAEAQARLPELISRALAGEEVVVTTDVAAVRLHVEELGDEDVPPAPPPGDAAALLAWLDRVRVPAVAPGAMDAAELVRRMRDEEI